MVTWRDFTEKVISYIDSNYRWSRINAWSHLEAKGNNITTKINAESRINGGSFGGP